MTVADADCPAFISLNGGIGEANRALIGPVAKSRTRTFLDVFERLCFRGHGLNGGPWSIWTDPPVFVRIKLK